MRLKYFLPILTFLSAPSLAQDSPDLIWVDFPKGKISLEINGVEGNANGQGIIVYAAGGKDVLLDSESMPDVVTKHGDSALLRLFTGGNACPVMYTWLTYDGQSLRATKEFGNCAEDGDLVKTSGYPAFILSRMGTTSGFRYDFDGRTVREKPISGK